MEGNQSSDVELPKIPHPGDYPSETAYFDAVKKWYSDIRQQFRTDTRQIFQSAFFQRPIPKYKYKIPQKRGIEAKQVLQLFSILINDTKFAPDEKFVGRDIIRDPFISDFFKNGTWKSTLINSFPDPNCFISYEVFCNAVKDWKESVMSKVMPDNIPTSINYFKEKFDFSVYKSHYHKYITTPTTEPLKHVYDRYPKDPVKFNNTDILNKMIEKYHTPYMSITIPYSSTFIAEAENFGINETSWYFTSPPIPKNLNTQVPIDELKKVIKRYPFNTEKDYHDLLVYYIRCYLTDNSSAMSIIFNVPWGMYCLIRAANLFSYNIPFVHFFEPTSANSVSKNIDPIVYQYLKLIYHLHYTNCVRDVIIQAKLSPQAHIIQDPYQFSLDCISFFEKNHASSLISWIMDNFDNNSNCITSVIIILLHHSKYFPVLYQKFSQTCIYFLNKVFNDTHSGARLISAIINSNDVKSSLIQALFINDIPSGLTYNYNPRALAAIEIALNGWNDLEQIKSMDCKWMTSRIIQCVVNVESEHGIQFSYITLALSRLLKRALLSKTTKARIVIIKDVIAYLATMCGEQMSSPVVHSILLQSLAELASCKEFQEFVLQNPAMFERIVSNALSKSDVVASYAADILFNGMEGLLSDARFFTKLRSFLTPFSSLLPNSGPETSSVLLRVLALVINEKSPKISKEQRQQVDVFMVLSTLPPDLALLFQLFDEGGFISRRAVGIVTKGTCSSRARKNRHYFEESLKAHSACHPLVAKIGMSPAQIPKKVVPSPAKKY